MPPASKRQNRQATLEMLQTAEYERAEEHIGRAFSRMHITWF